MAIGFVESGSMGKLSPANSCQQAQKFLEESERAFNHTGSSSSSPGYCPQEFSAPARTNRAAANGNRA